MDAVSTDEGRSFGALGAAGDRLVAVSLPATSDDSWVEPARHRHHGRHRSCVSAAVPLVAHRYAVDAHRDAGLEPRAAWPDVLSRRRLHADRDEGGRAHGAALRR